MVTIAARRSLAHFKWGAKTSERILIRNWKCNKSKFKDAYKTEGGHWRIPVNTFITSQEQDKKAKEVFRWIDAKNQEAGEDDEFDL
jgi:hypothetical protein